MKEFKIPKRFKHTYSETDNAPIYYTTVLPSGQVLVEWSYKPHTELRGQPVRYSKEDVEEYFSEGTWVALEEEGVDQSTSEVKPDAVNSPKHYAVFEDIEAIEIIARSMTKEMFKGYCLGNLLKYRLRAGGKDDVMQELSKANKYKELYDKYKDICQ